MFEKAQGEIGREASGSRGRGGRLAEYSLPASGVLIGMLLVVGPFLATVIRSLLYWDGDGAALSLQNFAALFSDPRFYQAVGNTALCGVGAAVISCVSGIQPGLGGLAHRHAGSPLV